MKFKKTYLSLASVPLFAGFAVANAAESNPSDDPTLQPTTLDAATLDGITAAGSNGKGNHRDGDGGDTTNQTNISVLSPQVNANVNVLGIQSTGDNTNFQGNISD